MSSIPNAADQPQVTSQNHNGVIGSGYFPATLRPQPVFFRGANLAQIIGECFEPIHRGPAYGAIRGWLEGQGDPWLDALSVSDAWWQPAQAALPQLLWLGAHWNESEVLRAVKDEAAAILRRRQSPVGKRPCGYEDHPMRRAWQEVGLSER